MASCHKRGCQKWFRLCAPIFLIYFWQCMWCDLGHLVFSCSQRRKGQDLLFLVNQDSRVEDHYILATITIHMRPTKPKQDRKVLHLIFSAVSTRDSSELFWADKAESISPRKRLASHIPARAHYCILSIFHQYKTPQHTVSFEDFRSLSEYEK